MIVVVHGFITTLLHETFGDQRIREALWESVLLDKVQTAYARAKGHADFLLDIEISGRPSTYNHYFNDNLQKARSERLTHAIQEATDEKWPIGHIGVKLSAVSNLTTNKSNADQVKEDIHDILKATTKSPARDL